MLLQLNPSIPVTCPKGSGIAHFITDYGIEHDLLWTVFVDETGECWTYSNRDIRAQKNITAGRTYAQIQESIDDAVEHKIRKRPP